MFYVGFMGSFILHVNKFWKVISRIAQESCEGKRLFIEVDSSFDEYLEFVIISLSVSQREVSPRKWD